MTAFCCLDFWLLHQKLIASEFIKVDKLERKLCFNDSGDFGATDIRETVSEFWVITKTWTQNALIGKAARKLPGAI